MANVAAMRRASNKKKYRMKYFNRLRKLPELAVLSPNSRRSFGQPWTCRRFCNGSYHNHNHFAASEIYSACRLSVQETLYFSMPKAAFPRRRMSGMGSISEYLGMMYW